MTIILAKILGLYFLAIGIALIINPNRFKSMYQQMMKDENFLLLGGIMALLIGAFIVSVHNIWVLGWPVIITVLGWWSLIKGFGLLIYSDFTRLFSFMSDRSPLFFRIIGFVWAVLGAFFIYQGWQ